MEPNDIEEGMRAGGWKDLTRNMPGNRPQGMSPEDWQDISPEMGRSTGNSTDPTAEQLMLLYRKLMNTLGTGQEGESLDARRMRRPGEMGMDRGWLGGMAGPEEGERENPMKLPRMKFEDITPGALGTGQEPPPTMPPSDAPSEPQTPPQGPGGGQPLPQWLLTLLRAHPELQQMLRGGWKPPAGTGQEPPPSPPGVGAPSPGGGPMIPPLDSQDVAGIGHRFGQPMNVGEPQHTGVDLQAPEGTPTKSPVDGFVQRIENNPQGLGVTVVIRGMDQSEHRLGHLKQTTAYPGMQVKMGQDLGSPVGDTGMTTGAHLHWGVRDGQGQPTDPTAALGPMAQMPPVPGTEMMGPPGGVGGSAQQGVAAQLPMGGGQEDDSSSASPYQARRPLPGEGGRRYPQRGVPEQAGWAKLSPEMLMEGLLKRGVLGTGQSGRRDGGTGAWRR
jgi:murein DD-endopeptidase MepM/ murein hydrolase activator NlpD